MAGVSIADLPDELLCNIFVYLEFAERITSTHVCQRWRAVSLDAPGQLWNEVASSARRLGVLEHVLARAGTVPVSLALSVTDYNVEEVATALTQHLGHCKVLRLQIMGEIGDRRARQLVQAMSTSAPLLERFALFDPLVYVTNSFTGNGSLFAGYAPRLLWLKLEGEIGLLRKAPALRSVRHFVYQSGVIVENDVTAAAEISPNLLDVGFQFGVCAFDPPSPFAITFPPNIQTVTLVLDGGAESRLSACLPPLNLSGLKRVTVTCCVSFLAEQESLDMLLLVLEKLALVPHQMYLSSYSLDDSAMFVITGRDGRSAEFNYIHPSISPSILLHLTVLEVLESSWNVVAHWPPAPVLQELKIVLIAPAFYDPPFVIGMFVEVRRELVLHCPALQTLSISTRRRGDPALNGFIMSIPPESLLLFVQHQLQTDKERIPLLKLCGLQIAVHHIDLLARVFHLFDDVQFEPGHADDALTPIEQLLDM
ncbi:hypothetical protein EXIGLDRAFT_701690 [Exidia glandulosa HHB12029]|uniref:F-box domain-containing protein n=1 Tax=Exidia glandulosa HHB12029 TaxID=1314781 RepID=A0A165Q5W6_EXIGL|nr:hypothetical protein EXIGLDRAFT_701690 [Exidia glandulosa HHB12029]